MKPAMFRLETRPAATQIECFWFLSGMQDTDKSAPTILYQSVPLIPKEKNHKL